MARFGFVGPSYQSQSLRGDAERCVNFYVEQIESPSATSPFALYRTPGLKTFCTLTDAPVRGNYFFEGRCFAVGGATLFELFADGSFVNRGAVANDNTLCTFAANQGNQLALTSGGTLYVLDLAAGGLLAAQVLLENYVSAVVFNDTYFLALLKKSGKMQISGALDGTSWPGAQVITVSTFADNPIAIVSDHREIWLGSSTRAIGYYDSGSSSIFDPIGPAAFIESGIAAPLSLVRADNTLFWIEQDERGQAIARRANGYTPQRISNHAVEHAWSQYPTISDCICYSFQDQGHIFIHYYFPSADASWRYDVATGMWHEPLYWDASNGRYQAHRSNCHAFAFGKHLVGDPQSGKIYDMSINYLDDDGNPLRRMRISPPISRENEWIRHARLQIDSEVGIGLQPPLLDGAGNPRDPQMLLSWSDDAGNTWSNEYVVPFGQAGDYLARAIRYRLGKSRLRIYKAVFTDAVPWAIVEADLLADNFQPMERLGKQFGKMS